MLNPEFKLLDPEKEVLERLATLAGSYTNCNAWQELFGDWDVDLQATVANHAAHELAKPGLHSWARVLAALQDAARKFGAWIPECGYWGWSENLLAGLWQRFPDPVVLVLGIMTGEGIWAGGFSGVSSHGLDFLSSFRYLWQDLPELASQQGLDDIGVQCRALEKHFSRPCRGLFLYKDEFIAWRDSQWSTERLDAFLSAHTAVKYGW